MKNNEFAVNLTLIQLSSLSDNREYYIKKLSKKDILLVNNKPIEKLTDIELFLAYDEFVFLGEED